MMEPVHHYEIDVQIDSDIECDCAERLEFIARAVLEAEQRASPTQLSLVLTSDERLCELNRKFSDVDSATDVLAFSAQEGPEFVLPGELIPYLGDVIVSYPTAVAQAHEHGQSVEDELSLLVVHGCLHLLGYDHATDEQQHEMWARQERILQTLQAKGSQLTDIP
jgi:probable rRNA maturation factor